MTRPQPPRTTDAILQNHLDRIRVLEALSRRAALVMTSNKYQVIGPEWQSWSEPVGVNRQNGVTPVLDASAPFTGYLDYNGSDGSYAVIGMPLGPRYSAWVVTVWYEQAPDKGILEFSWATKTIDEYADNGIGSSVSIARPPADDPANWYTVGGSTSNYQLDMYNAGTSWQYAKRSALVIVGANGTLLTADGAVPSTTGMDWTGGTARAMNAGGDSSLYWYLKLQVNGQNGLSSGFDCKLAGVSVTRYQGETTTVT